MTETTRQLVKTVYASNSLSEQCRLLFELFSKGTLALNAISPFLNTFVASIENQIDLTFFKLLDLGLRDDRFARAFGILSRHYSPQIKLEKLLNSVLSSTYERRYFKDVNIGFVLAKFYLEMTVPSHRDLSYCRKLTRSRPNRLAIHTAELILKKLQKTKQEPAQVTKDSLNAIFDASKSSTSLSTFIETLHKLINVDTRFFQYLAKAWKQLDRTDRRASRQSLQALRKHFTSPTIQETEI